MRQVGTVVTQIRELGVKDNSLKNMHGQLFEPCQSITLPQSTVQVITATIVRTLEERGNWSLDTKFLLKFYNKHLYIHVVVCRLQQVQDMNFVECKG